MRTVGMAILTSALLASVAAADYYPLKEGNQWAYSVSNGMQMTAKVTGFADVGSVRCAIVETAMGGQTTREYFAADAQGLKMHRTETQTDRAQYNPPVPRIKLPYKPGETWSATITQGRTPVSTSYLSVGTEQIQTPAGAFDCIRVRTTTLSMPPMVSTIWYADGVGIVQQMIQANGQTITASLTSTTVQPAGQASGAKPAAEPNAPPMEKYQSPDGKVLLYKPAGWTVTQGDMFGRGTYGVTIIEPQKTAMVLFVTFAATDEIKDSVVLAAKCITALRQKYPDIQASKLNSTPDRVRTLADISLTADGQKAAGHGYFFRTAQTNSVYILLARTALWDKLRPTLTNVAANVAYTPQGVVAVQEQGKQLAKEKGQPEVDQTPTVLATVMLQRATQQQGKQMPLRTAVLADQSLSMQIPEGWTFTGGKLQYFSTTSEQTASHGMCTLYYTIMPMDLPVQGVINVRYQAPPQALQTAMEFGKLGSGVQVLDETPTEKAVPEMAASIQQQRTQGFQVDSRLMHVRFRNTRTGAASRGIFVVQCSARPMTPVWQMSINGCWTPDAELEQWLPLFLRLGKTAKANDQWVQAELRNQAATQQRLNQNLQNSIAESNRAFDSYMDSVRDSGRSRDYISHMWSETTLGQGSWVAEGEGGKVYRTDSWGIEGPEGRVDSPAYNTTNFTGENPWTGRQMEMIDTRAEYEKYIANR
jgi:hypothetical protein